MAVSNQDKEIVVRRAGGLCEYCRCPANHSPHPFSIEHIIPRSRQGSDSLENLALSCQGCNNHKFTKTHALDPLSEEYVALYDPRIQRWRDHFTWSDDGSTICALSATGRATTEALNLNREGACNMRRLLTLSKLHPPEE